MADETQEQSQLTTVAPGAGVDSAATTTSGHVDPDEYAALQRQVAQYEQVMQRLSPHAARIQKLVEDDNAGQIFDDATSAYQALQERQKPQVPPELKPLDERMSVLEKLANEVMEERKAAAERPQREFAQKWTEWQNNAANDRFYKRMIQDHPNLTPRDLQWIAQEAADKNFIPLEEVWKENSWRFVKAEKAPPPTSLRSDSGEIGIPAASGNGTQAKTARERVIELERERLGRAS